MKESLNLAIAYLKKQKGRTFALLTGITLAVMLIFGFNTIKESQRKNQLDSVYKTFGSYDLLFDSLNKDTVKQIKNDNSVSTVEYISNLGKLLDKNGASIRLSSSNKDYLDQNMYTLEKGRLPSKPGEIVLEEKALERLGLSKNINQNLEFKVMKEYKDENNINQTFIKPIEFKLVGIVKRPNQIYKIEHYLSAITYFKEGENNIIPNNLITYNGVFNLKSSNDNLTQKAKEFEKKYIASEGNKPSIDENYFLMMALNEYKMAQDASNKDSIEYMVIITSIFLIYNIFNISLTEMVNQIGMIRAIGGSKKHIRMIIGFQSLIVLIIGAILGILFGIGFSYLSIKLFNYTFMDISTANVYISLKNILLALKVGVFTVFISTIIQIYLAGRISPINALRKSDKSSGRQKNRFYYKYIRKLFGITGEMAYKNVWRNKFKAIISILAISMGGTLFITEISMARSNPFKNMDSRITSMEKNSFELKYDLYNTYNNFVGYTNEDIKKISEINGVEDINMKISSRGFAIVNSESLPKGYKQDLGFEDEHKNIECPVEIKGYNDDKLNSFKKFVYEGSIPTSNNDSGEYPNAIVFNNYYCKNIDHTYKEAIKGLKVGDIIEFKVPILKGDTIEYKTSKARVGALLDKSWGGSGDNTGDDYLEIIMPQEKVMDIAEKQTYNEIFLKVKTEKSASVDKKLNHIIDEKNSVKTVDSRFEKEKKIDDSMQANIKSTYIQVAFLLTIAGLNIFITIKTNLLIRMTENSTLRAIGMSLKQVKIMIIKESLIYALSSSLIASIIGVCIHYKVFNKFNDMYKQGYGIEKIVEVKFPIVEVMQFTTISIIMCMLAVYISKKKIEKLSIVEGLKTKE
ncbi:FtsX-like permease family protein [Romboutsia sedimentorum]|uniref:ABC transporter permease n=1 Tax=Romboutsia sedimentorum TaxID=1368474 RepID=UPI0024DF055A|nr:ABC transporter permease [Romboutsia sedimentorum]MDK2587137.1 FtsX-like permease family protein [Romboutsia sedimentorum]